MGYKLQRHGRGRLVLSRKSVVGIKADLGIDVLSGVVRLRDRDIVIKERKDGRAEIRKRDVKALRLNHKSELVFKPLSLHLGRVRTIEKDKHIGIEKYERSKKTKRLLKPVKLGRRKRIRTFINQDIATIDRHGLANFLAQLGAAEMGKFNAYYVSLDFFSSEDGVTPKAYFRKTMQLTGYEGIEDTQSDILRFIQQAFADAELFRISGGTDYVILHAAYLAFIVEMVVQ